VATEFPVFVDTPDGQTPEPGTPDVDATWLNAISGAVNTIENTLPGLVDAGDLADVATSGAYTDLIGAPFIPTGPGDVGAAPVEHTHAYADITDPPTIPAAYTDEQARDAVASALVAGANVTITPDDNANTITIAATGGGGEGGAVDSVNGQTGVVVLTKTHVGLGNVDNTTDLTKPISTAMQAGLDAAHLRVDALDGISNIGTSGSAITVTAGGGNGTAKLMTLNQHCTITFAVNGTGIRSLEFVLTQDTTGGRTVTWASEVLWPGGTQPSLSVAAGAVDRFIFTTYDLGTTWYGDVIGRSYA
jgi:hypothetical protein